MDRQEFNRIVFEKLAKLNPCSVVLSDDEQDSITVEVVSNEFIGISVLKRINRVFELLSDAIESVDFNVDIVTLTFEEKENGTDEQGKIKIPSNKKSGYAARPSL